jgi:hypothetical protein
VSEKIAAPRHGGENWAKVIVGGSGSRCPQLSDSELHSQALLYHLFHDVKNRMKQIGARDKSIHQ